MMLKTEPVAIDVTLPDGIEFDGVVFFAQLSESAWDVANNQAIPQNTVRAALDNAGNGVILLWPNERGDKETYYTGKIRALRFDGSAPADLTNGTEYPLGPFQVPDSPGLHNLNDLLLAGIHKFAKPSSRAYRTISLALQQGLYLHLANYVPLKNLLADTPSIYDHVPTDATAPYVAIGETVFSDFDTDDSVGFEAETTLHVWSEYRGRYEAKQIQDAIYNALHRTDALTVAGAHVIDVFQTYADTDLDPDGFTRHGVQRFTITLEADNG